MEQLHLARAQQDQVALTDRDPAVLLGGLEVFRRSAPAALEAGDARAAGEVEQDTAARQRTDLAAPSRGAGPASAGRSRPTSGPP